MAWLAAEALVVFVGVYAAFWLDGYRAEQREAERRQQIYEALHQDATLLSRELARSIPRYDTLLVEPFMTAYQAGEQPLPEPLMFSSRGLGTRTWEAMLQSGGLDALDIDFVQEVDDFYTSLSYGIRQTEQYRELSETLILPHLDEGAEAFYDPETKRFKESYQWYPNSLRSMRSTMKSVQQQADTLQAKLEARMEQTVPTDSSASSSP